MSKRLKKNRRTLGGNNRKLRFEPLEARRMLTVTIKAANQDILISGDGANNGIAIFQDGSGGRLFIYGNTATAITGDGVLAGAVADTNAGGGREFDVGLFNNIFISLGAGNDNVQVAGLGAAQVGILSINTGDATTGDTVIIGQTTFAGNPDTVYGVNSVSKSVSITGTGAAIVAVDALTAPALTIDTQAGTINLASIDDVVVNGDLSVDASKSATIFIGQNAHTLLVDGNLTLNCGANDNLMVIDGLTVGNVAGNFNITTGAGNDIVSLGIQSAVSVAHGSLNVDLGDAAKFNTFNLGTNQAVTVSGDVTVRTGSGNTSANSIKIDSLTAVNVNVTGGNGDDGITFAAFHPDTITGSLSINTGNAGNIGDVVSVGTATASVTISRNLTVIEGSNASSTGDIINLDNATANYVSFTAGEGKNNVLVGLQGAAVTATIGLAIKTGGNVDRISVNRLTSGAINIDSGAGADTVNVGVTGGAVTATNGFSLNLGDGDDQASVNQLIAAYLSLEAGEGNNTLNIGDQNVANSSIGGLIAIHGGAGIDVLNFDRVLSGNDVVISLGNGENDLRIGFNGVESSSGSFVISGGSAVDNISLQQVYMVGNLVLNGGAGDDVISIDGSSAQGVIAVSAGEGNDNVTLNNVTSLSDLSISLGTNAAAGPDKILKITGSGIVGEASISSEAGCGITLNSNTFARNLNILGTGGDGGNGYNFYNTNILGNLCLVTSAAQDNIQVGNLSAKIFYADAGGGDDFFDVDAMKVDHFFAELGAGSDSLAVLNSTLRDYGLIDGGSGANLIGLDGTSLPRTTVVNF